MPNCETARQTDPLANWIIVMIVGASLMIPLWFAPRFVQNPFLELSWWTICFALVVAHHRLKKCGQFALSPLQASILIVCAKALPATGLLFLSWMLPVLSDYLHWISPALLRSSIESFLHWSVFAPMLIIFIPLASSVTVARRAGYQNMIHADKINAANRGFSWDNLIDKAKYLSMAMILYPVGGMLNGGVAPGELWNGQPGVVVFLLSFVGMACLLKDWQMRLAAASSTTNSGTASLSSRTSPAIVRGTHLNNGCDVTKSDSRVDGRPEPAQDSALLQNEEVAGVRLKVPANADPATQRLAKGSPEGG